MVLTPRSTDFSARYNDLVDQAGLAQNSPVRGCMVIKPNGYAIWENMQSILDYTFKATGHRNAYFPLLIPKSFFTKEAKHVEGFATESAVVTHYRLKAVPKKPSFSPEWSKKGEKYELTNDGYICSARAVIQNGQGEYLFLYDHRRDVYALPGGKVDRGETGWDAMKREVNEELGIEIISGTLLGSVKTIWSSGGSCGSYYLITDYTGTPSIQEPDKFTSLHRVKAALVDGKPTVWVDGINIQDTYTTPRWMRHCRDACVLADRPGLAQATDTHSYHYETIETINDDERYVCLVDRQTGDYHCVHHDEVQRFSNPYVFLTQSGKELTQGFQKMYGSSRNTKETEIIVDPDAKLEEELIIRPTSETIIWHTFKDWIHSYRDLPLLINQWANVVRWEMRTRAFLRTAEFLWQEGHTAHATSQEAQEEAKKMRDVYRWFHIHALAIDGVMGEKTENERFAGADNTYTIERMMQDGKALQSCTSHFLGQSFGKAFDVTFTNKDNKPEFAWATSWGLSTRALGGMIMSHSDDKGLVLPPAIAPIHVVFVPIFKTQDDLDEILAWISPLVDELRKQQFIVGCRDGYHPSVGNINQKKKIGTDESESQYSFGGLDAADRKPIEDLQYDVMYRETGNDKNRSREQFSFDDLLKKDALIGTFSQGPNLIASVIGASVQTYESVFGDDVHHFIASQTTNPKAFYFDSFVVKKEFRKNGLGTKLYSRREQFLQSRGYTEIRLSVSQKKQHLSSWYQKLGYSRIGSVDDDDIMKKSLMQDIPNIQITYHTSTLFPPNPNLETKSRQRVLLLIKHPTAEQFLVIYTKGTTKLNVLPGGGVDEGEDRETAARRELVEETGYHDIASITDISGEHHWTNAADGEYNRTSKQRCFLVQLASLDQQDIDAHEQSLHDCFWVDSKNMAITLQDNENVHHGAFYRNLWQEQISKQDTVYHTYLNLSEKTVRDRRTQTYPSRHIDTLIENHNGQSTRVFSVNNIRCVKIYSEEKSALLKQGIEAKRSISSFFAQGERWDHGVDGLITIVSPRITGGVPIMDMRYQGQSFDTNEASKETVALIRKLHQNHKKGEYHTQELIDSCHTLYQQCLQQKTLPIIIQQHFEKLIEEVHPRTITGNMSLIHGDIHIGNIITMYQNGRNKYELIDRDQLKYGPIWLEIPMLVEGALIPRGIVSEILEKKYPSGSCFTLLQAFADDYGEMRIQDFLPEIQLSIYERILKKYSFISQDPHSTHAQDMGYVIFNECFNHGFLDKVCVASNPYTIQSGPVSENNIFPEIHDFSFVRPLEIKIDTDPHKSMGWKLNQYELEGVPLIIPVGKKDREKGSLDLKWRDSEQRNCEEGFDPSMKHHIRWTIDNGKNIANEILDGFYCMQRRLLERNRRFREQNTVTVDTREQFVQALDQGKFVMAHWDGTTETELRIKEETKATIRCITPRPLGAPLDREDNAVCIRTGKPSQGLVLFARAY